MDNQEKILEKCTEMVLAIEMMSTEVPKIRELLDECGEIKQEFIKLADTKMEELEKRYNMVLTKANNLMKEVEDVVEVFGNTGQEMMRSIEFIKSWNVVMSYIPKIKALEKKVDKLEKNIDEILSGK